PSARWRNCPTPGWKSSRRISPASARWRRRWPSAWDWSTRSPPTGTAKPDRPIDGREIAFHIEKNRNIIPGMAVEARVDGKVALVTGATQGIGRAIAETLARSGCAGLLLTGRDAARGEAVAAEMAGLGTPSRFVAGDLADPALPPRLVEECLRAFGRIDVLVNVAALTDRASFLDADPAL